MEDQISNIKNQKWVQRIKAISWRKVGLGLLVFVLMVLAFLGGHLSMDWYLAAHEPGLVEEWKYGDWQVYKNETYGFGLRYRKDWEATEVKPEFVVFKPLPAKSSDSAPDKEERKVAKEYISLAIVLNKNRGKTACEEDQSECSFYTNGIFGERITTPEEEIVFFAHGENDFTTTLHKYLLPADSPTPGVGNSITPKADSSAGSAETIEDYIAIFEEMAKSFRFTSQVTSSCEKDTDCALGVRLDKCCSCPEAFTVSEIEANPSIAVFEVGKDYSKERKVDCSAVYCSPCPTPPSGAACVSNRCKPKEQ